ncbi:MAG: flagellar filament capping protein FliD [Firmicutes bacterium]|nr:flagellar filament capping protein FliD [Bacillota bacterium]
MASISSVNSSGSGLSSSLQGFGGLASGLDRDSLIEQFTAATRSKIAKQKQQQQKLEWTQTAIRNITSKIYNFSNSFTSYSSATNLTSKALFSRSQISAVGENSKYVSVTGTAASAENLSISRIKQLASNASMSTGSVSAKTLSTAEISATGNLSDKKEISAIEGDALYVRYGDKLYSVSMKAGATDAASAATMINEQLKTVEISGDKTLADVMKAGVEGGKLSFETVNNANGNKLELAGGTGDILKDLGFGSGSDIKLSGADGGKVVAENDASVTKEVTLYEHLSEKSITFNYNGQKQTIKLDKYNENATLQTMADDLQTKLNETYGRGRVQVETDGKSLSFKTILPAGGDDTSASFSIVSGKDLVGDNGIFGVKEGASNRINMSATLENAGFAAGRDFSTALDGDNYNLVINGVKIEGITKDSTVNDIVKAINDSKAGVKVSYQSISDQFVITSTEAGASGKIDFDVPAGQNNLATLMFGTPDATNFKEGKDAILSVKYPGSEEEIDITRSSNSFDLDGISVTLKGTFGYEGDNKIDTEEISFSASVDSEKTTKAVKDMVTAFNEILELVNKELTTKPNRDYAPLTDEQKDEMTESQIEKWEEKANSGLLFGDSDLRAMASSLRSIINSADRSKLAEMGITVSENYSDNGKLVFDEAKFKAALEKDPESVHELLNRASSKNEDGTKVQGGLLTKMSEIMDRYGRTTGASKGILINRAGSVHAPTSVLSNSIQKQIDSLDDLIDSLNNRLKTEQDRYIKQFTSLETLISQMNSQSSYLSGMFAY